MESTEKTESSEEIVIVGSKYGELADVVNPLYEKGEPIEKEDIARLLGSETVYLRPKRNEYDKYAVGVYTENSNLLGYVWTWQSYAVREWLKEKKMDYVPVNINRINSRTELMMATSSMPMKLGKANRSEGIDMSWASDLPEELTCINEEAQELGLSLLKAELAEAKGWNDRLKLKINNVLYYLRSNRSRQSYDNCIDIHNMMMMSPDKEVREQGEWFLKKLVNKGSKEQVEWWVNEWLPEFMKTSCGEETLELYKASGYTLEKVEDLLKDAPCHLFQMYNVNKYRFANQLYYSALPQKIYYRLLTLLTLWEAMGGDLRCKMDDGRCEDEEEMFHFVHPAMDEVQERKIHNEVKKLVKRQNIQMICLHLLQMKKESKLLLPPNPSIVYAELVRIGMPITGGFNENTFRKYYRN